MSDDRPTLSKKEPSDPRSSIFDPRSSAEIFRLPKLSGPMVGLLALLGLFILLLALKGQLRNFFALPNIQVLFWTSSIPAVVALGMLLIIISGGIDLSVGSVVALVTVVTMQVYRLVYNGAEFVLPEYLVERGWNWKGTESAALATLAAVPTGILLGGLCGLCNGVVITRLKVAPFVATLGMLSVARGLAIWLAGRTVISFRGPRPEWVDTMARSDGGVLLFDPGVWSFVVLAVLVAVLLKYSVFGRYCYAIGSNEATARLCGIDISRYKIMIYSLSGLLAGWAGILAFAHAGIGDPNGSVGLELIVIAAVVIGGASLSGGQGTVSGTLLGVLILGIMENGVSFFGVQVEMKHVLIGAIVVINTALSQWQRRRSE
jgi:ribose/xylose/arabinose/galactoside ABC-type transport system permease subunit